MTLLGEEGTPIERVEVDNRATFWIGIICSILLSPSLLLPLLIHKIVHIVPCKFSIDLTMGVAFHLLHIEGTEQRHTTVVCCPVLHASVSQAIFRNHTTCQFINDFL